MKVPKPPKNKKWDVKFVQDADSNEWCIDIYEVNQKTGAAKPANITQAEYLAILKGHYKIQLAKHRKLYEEAKQKSKKLNKSLTPVKIEKWERTERLYESLAEDDRMNDSIRLDLWIRQAKTPATKETKPEVYKNPRDLADITQSLFSNTGFKDLEFMGYTNEQGIDKAKWQKEKLTALVPTKDLPLLDQRTKKNPEQGYLIPTPPTIAVSQAKNIDTLVVLLEKENRKRDRDGQGRTGDVEFSLKEYSKIRGKSESELARGGKFIKELKRDLISGGITSYIVDLEKTTGRKSYLIQNFYGLEVPKAKSRGKWRVIFNEPYKTHLLDSKQYYPILLEAIQDKNTDDRKGYLYFFFKLVVSYASTTDFKTQLKVSTLLDKIKISEGTKARPQEAFKVLCECIYYTATKYKTIKEVRFFESGKCKKVKVITDLEKFKEWSYSEFKKEVLAELGLTDIREALISFNVPPTVKTAKAEETRQTGQDRTTL